MYLVAITEKNTVTIFATAVPCNSYNDRGFLLFVAAGCETCTARLLFSFHRQLPVRQTLNAQIPTLLLF